mgnify:CR=1 FL=1
MRIKRSIKKEMDEKRKEIKDKVEELLALGDISILEKLIHPLSEKNHSFHRPEREVTVAYSRDRGEKINPARVYESRDKSYVDMEEYLYLFSEKENKWYVKDHEEEFVELTEELINSNE